ncbi:MAG: T9SS C-terminal target domain-containing protein [Calditrichaeota bacterium]|nr:MAG: T9SS C-terminal target domain-containing protein [Calditrichota bacterium]
MRAAIALFSLVLFTGSLMAQAGQVKTHSGVIGSGGASISNENYRMIGTVGQPLIGRTSNADHIHQAGFWYRVSGLITSVEQIATETIPTEFRLDQNYPNPFNPSTTIRFALPKRSHVSLKLYDLLGREVATLVDEEHEPGEYKVVFEAHGLPSGVYFYRIEAEGFVKTRKLMLLK